MKLELLEDGRYDEANSEWNRVYLPLREFQTNIGEKSGGQARLKKGLMKVSGKDIGDSRPPSLPLSIQEIDELREIVRGLGFPVV